MGKMNNEQWMSRAKRAGLIHYSLSSTVIKVSLWHLFQSRHTRSSPRHTREGGYPLPTDNLLLKNMTGLQAIDSRLRGNDDV